MDHQHILTLKGFVYQSIPEFYSDDSRLYPYSFSCNHRFLEYSFVFWDPLPSVLHIRTSDDVFPTVITDGEERKTLRKGYDTKRVWWTSNTVK